MTHYKNIMIFCEIVEGKLGAVTKELLGCGRTLSNELGEELVAVFIGSEISRTASEAIAFGADKVYVVDDPLVKDYQTDSYLLSMAKIFEQEMPRILIFGQTSIGIDLSPRLAFKLNTTIVLDCVELSIDPGTKQLLRTKPVYGGKAMATFFSEFYPQLATVRPNSMPPSERNDSRKGKVIAIDAGLDPSLIRTKVLGKVTEKIEGIKLEDAEVIISGGRGIGGTEGFKQLKELVKKIKGAAVGATRSACDAGWVPTTMQIGLTGKIVTPNLYIAIALSGASQHMAGCSGSKTIVAINKDSEANIFKEAQFGVIGDWEIVLPPFIRKIE
ncbi:MAG: electron transfer flavoprotein subunit alpha/FixB family protein, partial [Candidatus Hodarchaeota archaeon]